jgi:hypothetical protein
MRVEIPPEELSAAVSAGVRNALQGAGIVDAVHAAIEAQLALRGLLDKAEAMKFLRIKSERTLELWMKPAGDNGGRGLPYLKIGDSVRFKLASLEAWSVQYEVNKVLPKAA